MKLKLATTIFLIASGLQATMIYQTGFEPPAYSASALNGQNGWTAVGNAVVQSQTTYSGSQAVQMTGAGSLNETASHSLDLPAETPDTDLVKAQVKFRVDAITHAGWQWNAITLYDGTSLAAAITVGQEFAGGSNGPVVAVLTSAPVVAVPVALGGWNSYQLNLGRGNG